MGNINVVVLTGFEDIFKQFETSVNKYEPSIKRTVVTSNSVNVDVNPDMWNVVKGPEHFIFAHNANLGINSFPESDILLTNDDVQFTQYNSISTLMHEAYSDPDIGIISPVIHGQVGNILQYFNPDTKDNNLIYSQERLAFVCVLIKREVINKIGLLDEQFDGYGGDDVDYCIRAQKAGYKLAVTPKVVVKHGFEHCRASSSFNRSYGFAKTHLSMLNMNKIVQAKHSTIRFKYE